MAKNLILANLIQARFWLLSPKFGPQFLWYILPPLDLDFDASYHCMHFQGKLMIQIQEIGEKPHLGSNLGRLGPNSGQQIFFQKPSFVSH